MGKKNKKEEPITVIVLLDNLKIEYINSKCIDKYLDNKQVSYFLIPVSVSELSVYVPIKRKRLKSLCKDFHHCNLSYSFVFKCDNEFDTLAVVDDMIIDVTYTNPVELLISLQSLRRIYAINSTLVPTLHNYTEFTDIGLFDLTIYSDINEIVYNLHYEAEKNDIIDDSNIFEVGIMNIISQLEFMKEDFIMEFSNKKTILGINTRDLTWGIFKPGLHNYNCNIHGIYSTLTDSIYFFNTSVIEIFSNVESLHTSIAVLLEDKYNEFDMEKLIDGEFDLYNCSNLIHESQLFNYDFHNFVYLFDIFDIFKFIVFLYYKNMYSSDKDSQFHLYMEVDVNLKNTTSFMYKMYDTPSLKEFIELIIEKSL